MIDTDELFEKLVAVLAIAIPLVTWLFALLVAIATSLAFLVVLVLAIVWLCREIFGG